MALTNYSFTALIDSDPNGQNIIANQAVSVNVKGGGLASIFSDDAGTTPIPQPGAQTDSNGVLEFFIADGVYTITSGTRTEEVNITSNSDKLIPQTLSEMTARSGVAVGDSFIVSDRANGIFRAKTGLTGNGFDIIQSLTNPLIQYELDITDTVNVAQFGAIGDGTNGADTGAFRAARDRINSGDASIFYVPDPQLRYSVDIIQFTADSYTIEHESIDTHVQLIPLDLTAITNTYVYQLNGGTPTVIKGLLDGNKANQINAGTANNDHECLDLKSCIEPKIINVYVIDSVGDGIDLDSCSGGLVLGCNAENTGGYGIHNSVNSSGVKIWSNRVNNCGHDKLRGGIDAFKAVGTAALNGDYRGNHVSNCYRNYNIAFNNDVDKLKSHYFDSSNLSTGTTIQGDILTGVKPMESYSSTPEYIFNRGFAATGCRMVMPNANTLEFRRWRESDSTDELVMSIDILGSSGITLPFASSGINFSPASGVQWQVKRDGADGFIEFNNNDSGAMERIFSVDRDGDIVLSKAGRGVVLVSPDGLTTRKLTIDNSGALAITAP